MHVRRRNFRDRLERRLAAAPPASLASARLRAAASAATVVSASGGTSPATGASTASPADAGRASLSPAVVEPVPGTRRRPLSSRQKAEQAAIRRFLEQVAEAAETEVAFVEARLRRLMTS
jgi:hypothetical protein